jgi:uncharacterized membrane protein
MDDGNPKYLYTPRSISIAVSSGSITISLIVSFFILSSLFNKNHHAPPPISNAFVLIAIICCCISYITAGGLAFYFREFFQKYIPVWLIISFLGSTFFSFSNFFILYFLNLEKIKRYKEVYGERTSIFSPDWTRPPDLPAFWQFVGLVLILTLIFFVITTLVSYVSSYVASMLPKKKEEPYTLLEL